MNLSIRLVMQCFDSSRGSKYRKTVNYSAIVLNDK